MKYSTIVPAFLFLAGSALLPISSYAVSESSKAEKDASTYCQNHPDSEGCSDEKSSD